MKKEKICELGEKIGLNKQEINETLTKIPFNNKQFSISYLSDCYKNGTMYGSISINDYDLLF